MFKKQFVAELKSFMIAFFARQAFEYAVETTESKKN